MAEHWLARLPLPALHEILDHFGPRHPTAVLNVAQGYEVEPVQVLLGRYATLDVLRIACARFRDVFGCDALWRPLEQVTTWGRRHVQPGLVMSPTFAPGPVTNCPEDLEHGLDLPTGMRVIVDSAGDMWTATRKRKRVHMVFCPHGEHYVFRRTRPAAAAVPSRTVAMRWLARHVITCPRRVLTPPDYALAKALVEEHERREHARSSWTAWRATLGDGSPSSTPATTPTSS